MNEHRVAVRAVTFDLWETLLFETDGASARRADARCRNLVLTLRNLGVQVSFEGIRVAVSETVSSLVAVWEENRDIGCVDQIGLIVNKASKGTLGLKKEWINELVNAYALSIFEVPPFVNPEAREVLEHLKQRGKLIGLICNTGLTPGVALRRVLADGGLSGYFDTMVFSEEVGIRKPDPGVFHLAARTLCVLPGEIVHVGDNLRTDVWGAKNAGLRAIHLSSLKGRDRLAESDRNSLVSLSRKLDKLQGCEIVPDGKITSLAMVVEAIQGLEKGD